MMHSPIKVITVEREYGSRGGEFAHDLAEKLAWRLLDSELVAGAARSAGVDPKLALKFDERLDPWYYRYGKVFWHDSGYSMTAIGDEHFFDSERMLTLIKQQILARPKRATAFWWAGVQHVRSPDSLDAFTCLSTPLPAPNAIGSPRRFLGRRNMRTSIWLPSTSGARRLSASSISRSGVRAGFITCC